MIFFNLFHKQRLRFGLLVVLLAALASGFVATTQAQGQVCRDYGNLTVCGDHDIEETGALQGNIRLGPKGQAPVVRATSYPSQDPSEPNPQSSFFETSEGRASLYGSLELINAPRSLPLVQSFLRKIPGHDEPIEGRFDVDTTKAPANPARSTSAATPASCKRPSQWSSIGPA